MAQQQHQDTPIIGFRSIQLLKTQTLGIGSYGSVCKAKCDDLLCAAKIIHPTLYDPTAQQQIDCHREHRLPFRRFQQECEFMSAIKHPNIVQYLGMHQDSETGLPVLLMELMDDSLTHFLESSQDPVPYHIQVNICHDITIAISYLHSNGITHRDLSSNNVLLRGNVIAKVTDFGMAKLGDANPQATRISLTMVPGTDAYMPPEAVRNPPVYTAKIDCFSIGTLIIQILTRQFPNPADRHKSIQIDHPQFPGGTVDVRVPEIERRQNHISQVKRNHPLLPIALDCLKDSDVERPSAQELCHRVAALKETAQYTESVRSAQERRPEQDKTSEREEQIRELQQQIQHKNDIIQEKDDIIRGKDQLIRNQGAQVQHLTQHLDTTQQVTVQLQTQVRILEEQLKTKFSEDQVQVKPQPNLRDPEKSTHHPIAFKLMWKKEKSAPHKFIGVHDAVVKGDTVYIRLTGTRTIFAYKSTNDTWTRLTPDCPIDYASLAVVKNILTTIGGGKKEKTNQLFSLNRGNWKEIFPPMPTKRSHLITTCTEQALIASGGHEQSNMILRTVEIMHIATKQWSTAADLPKPLYFASATICEDRVYMLGGWSERRTQNKSVYTCSLADLFLSCRSSSLGERLVQTLLQSGQAKSTVWNKVADLPVKQSTCVTFHGRLLAIGGSNSKNEPVSDIHMYNTTSNQWEVISNMSVPRQECIAAVLPTNELMVIGGYNTGESVTSSVEKGVIV